MEQEIIKYYQENNINLTLKKFNIGKLKLKKILIDNGVDIRKKGGQYKTYVKKEIDLSSKILICKKTGKVFNDVYNNSGTIIKHLKSTYPDLEYPSQYKRRVFENKTGHPYYLDFFNVEDKPEREKISCPECGWSSYDLDNKTGSLTKHVKKQHGDIESFIEKYPNFKIHFVTITKKEETILLHSDDNLFVICEICNQKFKTITNTHLVQHNVTLDDYILKYGDKIISNNLKLKYKNQLQDIDTSIFYHSKEEKEIEEFVKTLGVKYVSCDKKMLNGVELDLYFPDHKIAIEYNGLYWHSEKNGKTKNYHIEKTKKCLDSDIHLIHIFSDEWANKKEIIKNRLRNLFRLNENKIYARQCVISEISQKEKSEFLRRYHLQGNDKSSIYFGLKYRDVLVAVMSFGKKRRSLGSIGDGYELYRYASNGVVGGFTKMLKHFVNTHSPKEIITYADRNWSPSDLFCFYGKVGFKYLGITKPNYYYLRNYSKRLHRFNFRKDRLISMGHDPAKSEAQIMSELGYDKIWDTGNLKYGIYLDG